MDERVLKVKKHNKKLEDFDISKIQKAIESATEGLKEEIPQSTITRIANDVYGYFISQKDLTLIKVDDISEQVENKLMASNYKDTARNYIKYHYDREKERLYNAEIIKEFKKKLNGLNIENQNANQDEHSFSGRMNEAARVMLKDYALNNLVSNTTKENHINNKVYIHDLDNYAAGTHNCLSIPIDSLLEKGYNTRNGDSRRPHSIDAAIQLMVGVMQIQSIEQFGGVSLTHIDWSMVPFIRHSFYKFYRDGLKYICNEDIKKLTEDKIEHTSIEDLDFYSNKKAYQYALNLIDRELHQGFESFYHECNQLGVRSGGQLPFSSINFGTCILKEGQLCINAILDACMDGMGKLHKTYIFPCGIWQYMRGVNDKPRTPNYELYKKALKSTAMRIYPNYVNCDWSGDKIGLDRDRKFKQELLNNLSEDKYNKLLEALKLHPNIAEKLSLKPIKNIIEVNRDVAIIELTSSMGCRTYNGYDINSQESIKKNIEALINNKPLYDDIFSGAQKDGRGNIAPTTIILPTIAMEADKDVEKFMKLLDKTINEAKDSLIDRFNYIASQSPKSASFMYGNRSMAGYVPEEGIISALRHGTLVIGQLGMAECLELLVGCNHIKPLGMELAKRIEQLYKDKCAQFKEEYKLNFGVYYTPSENLCYTAMNKFKEKYGIIKNVSDHDFFTNSMHIPVWEDVTPFEKIDLESQLTGYHSGGCITYVEIESNAEKNIPAMEKIVNYAMNKDVPYFALNIKLDQCMNPQCGYRGEIDKVCPKCGGKDIEHLARVTGYLSCTVENMNLGKQAEVSERVKHIGKIDC